MCASGHLLRRSETALDRAQRQGQIRIMCALQQQWKAAHLERSWAVRKQRESLLDLKRMVAVRVPVQRELPDPLPTGRSTIACALAPVYTPRHALRAEGRFARRAALCGVSLTG